MGYKYYIKLYHEILHDRKMGVLTDALWRRVIECFLLAGEMDNAGHLPPIDDIAWTLRADIEQLESDLEQLVGVGILAIVDGGYVVKKFAERQSPMPKKEYMSRKRETDKKEKYYQNNTPPLPDSYQPVTNSHTEVVKEDIDKIRGDRGETAAAVTSFHSHTMADAQRLYTEITEQLEPPYDKVDIFIKNLTLALDTCKGDWDRVVEKGKQVYSRWCNTRAKDGRYYSKTNPVWTEWLIDALIPDPAKPVPAAPPATTPEEDAIINKVLKGGGTNREARKAIIDFRTAKLAKEKSV